MQESADKSCRYASSAAPCSPATHRTHDALPFHASFQRMKTPCLDLVCTRRYAAAERLPGWQSDRAVGMPNPPPRFTNSNRMAQLFRSSPMKVEEQARRFNVVIEFSSLEAIMACRPNASPRSRNCPVALESCSRVNPYLASCGFPMMRFPSRSWPGCSGRRSAQEARRALPGNRCA